MEKTDFEILSEKLRPKLLSVARNFAYASGIEAEDVVQETLIALWNITLQGQEVRNIETQIFFAILVAIASMFLTSCPCRVMFHRAISVS